MERIENKELEMYFYMTATPEERSEMRREQYEGDDWYDEDDWDEEYEVPDDWDDDEEWW